jgi:hypothetical protein
LINVIYEANVKSEKDDRDKRKHGHEAYLFEKYINLSYFSGLVYDHVVSEALQRAAERVKAMHVERLQRPLAQTRLSHSELQNHGSGKAPEDDREPTDDLAHTRKPSKREHSRRVTRSLSASNRMESDEEQPKKEKLANLSKRECRPPHSSSSGKLERDNRQKGNRDDRPRQKVSLQKLESAERQLSTRVTKSLSKRNLLDWKDERLLPETAAKSASSTAIFLDRANDKSSKSRPSGDRIRTNESFDRTTDAQFTKKRSPKTTRPGKVEERTKPSVKQEQSYDTLGETPARLSSSKYSDRETDSRSVRKCSSRSDLLGTTKKSSLQRDAPGGNNRSKRSSSEIDPAVSKRSSSSPSLALTGQPEFGKPSARKLSGKDLLARGMQSANGVEDQPGKSSRKEDAAKKWNQLLNSSADPISHNSR